MSTCVNLRSLPPRRDAIHRLFLRYKEEDEEGVGVEGISQLCADLGVEPDDIVVLVLRWVLRRGRGQSQTLGAVAEPAGINTAARPFPAQNSLAMDRASACVGRAVSSSPASSPWPPQLAFWRRGNVRVQPAGV